MKTIKELLKEYIKELTGKNVMVDIRMEPETVFEGAYVKLGNVLFYIIEIEDLMTKAAVVSSCWRCGTRNDIVVTYMPDLEERTFTTEKAIVELDLVYEVPVEVFEHFGDVISANLNKDVHDKIVHYATTDEDIPLIKERGIGSDASGLHKEFKDFEAKRSWEQLSDFIVP